MAGSTKALLLLFYLSLLVGVALAQEDDNVDVVEAGGGDEEDPNNIELDTYLGPIIGKRVEREGPDGGSIAHYEFLGIPYAEPPVDELRFHDPLPKRPWTDPLDAKDYGDVCPQLAVADDSFIGDEDCLTLNVYTPRIPTLKAVGRALTRSYLLPVLVFFNGKLFTSGGSEIVAAPMLDQDIVVVTMNYRLGALGFLNLNSPQAPGNQGLKDQLEAIKWVNRNVALFGGDPSRITLGGLFDGGASAHLHQISPQGRGLYSGIIAQSGTALSGFIETLKSSKVQRESARLLETQGCGESEAPFECLRNKEVEALLRPAEYEGEAETKIEEAIEGFGDFYFMPSIDAASPNPFLPEHPYLTLMAGRQKDIPIVAGTGQQDGLALVKYATETSYTFEDINGNWSFYGPALVQVVPFDDIVEKDQVVANVTRQYYLGEGEITADVEDKMVKMVTDSVFRAPNIKALKLQSSSQNAPVFYYERSHEQENPARSNFFGITDESNFIFGRENLDSENDLVTSDVFIKMWSDFVKFGDPTPFQDANIPQWKPYDEKTQKYMDIGPEPELKSRPSLSHMYFWQKIYFDEEDKSFRNRLLLPSGAGIGLQSGVQSVGSVYPYPFRPSFIRTPSRPHTQPAINTVRVQRPSFAVASYPFF